LTFTRADVPEGYQGDVFVALHGSWNRTRRTGYKIIRIRFKNGKPVGGYDDFLTGWMLDEIVETFGPGPWTTRAVGRLDAYHRRRANKIWRVTYSGK